MQQLKSQSIDGSPPRRVIMRIELYPSAKQLLNSITDAVGMTQVAAVSRILESFAGLPEEVRAEMLGLYPKKVRVDVAKGILKMMQKSRVRGVEKQP